MAWPLKQAPASPAHSQNARIYVPRHLFTEYPTVTYPIFIAAYFFVLYHSFMIFIQQALLSSHSLLSKLTYFFCCCSRDIFPPNLAFTSTVRSSKNRIAIGVIISIVIVVAAVAFIVFDRFSSRVSDDRNHFSLWRLKELSAADGL